MCCILPVKMRLVKWCVSYAREFITQSCFLAHVPIAEKLCFENKLKI